MEALPRVERSVRMAGGVTIRAGSLTSSLASSLSSSRGIVGNNLPLFI